MYTLYDYGGMIADHGRTRAYAESLKRLVTPSSVVVDIGTGTGVLALLSGQLGARKVYAIDPSDTIQLGRRVAAENGLDARIEFIQGVSTDVQLPEKADIIVSDIHGVLPAHERSLFSIMDARDRFLGSPGYVIPLRETLWAAIVDAATLHREIVGVWGTNVFGVDMTAIRATAMNTWRKSRMAPADLVTAPACWASLDYADLRSPHVRGDATWEIGEPCTAHGIAVWFDWDGGGGVTFSNSPLSEERHLFGQAFFPWPTPLLLCSGDEVRVQLRSNAVGSEYVYGWETSVRGKDGGTKAAFQQHDFLGQVLTVDLLRKLSSSFMPTLNEDGRIDRMILDGVASERRLEQIARDVSAGFPHRFAAWTDALTRVSQVSSRYA
jgi:protein arginine N-methyltransferase 1